MEELLDRNLGTITVTDRQVRMRGIINGDLYVEGNSQVDFDGIVRGCVTLSGGSLYLQGLVRKNVTNNGGHLTVRGLVKGRVATHTGETVLQEGSLIGLRTA